MFIFTYFFLVCLTTCRNLINCSGYATLGTVRAQKKVLIILILMTNCCVIVFLWDCGGQYYKTLFVRNLLIFVLS